MLSQRQCDFTHALALLIIRIAAKGYSVKIQELNRTIEQQRQYLKDGASKTLNSMHLKNLAADLVLFKDGKLIADGEQFREFGEYWEDLGGRWGGRFGLEDQPRSVQDSKLGWDPFHVEYREMGNVDPPY